MNTQRLQLPKAKESLRASLSPDRIQFNLKNQRSAHHLRPPIKRICDCNDNNKFLFNNALSVKSIHVTPIRLRGKNTEISTEQEKSSNRDSVPNTDRIFPRDSAKGTLRPISLGLDSRIPLTSRVSTRNVSSNRGSSKSPNLRGKYSNLSDRINLSQNSLDLKPYERGQEASLVLNKEAFLLNYKKIKERISNVFNSKKPFQPAPNTIEKIIALRAKPQPFDVDFFSKNEEFEKEFSLKIRVDNASKNNKKWAPLGIFRSDSPIRIKLPKRVPKLMITAVKPQISARESMFDDLNLNTGRQNEPLTHRPKTSRYKAPVLGIQLAYDQKSINKYIVDFSRLVSISEHLSQAIDKENIGEEISYQNLQDLIRASKAGTETNPTVPNLSNTRGYLKSKSVFLCVLKEHYPKIFKGSKAIAERLFFALDIDQHELTRIDWGHYLLFIKTIVKQEASRSDATNFILRFFKGEEPALTVSNCQKIIKDIIQGYENDTKGYEIAKELESSLHQRWNELVLISYEIGRVE